jgi:hypothetical protein
LEGYKTSIKTGITRLYDFTARDAYDIYQAVRDTIKAILMFRNWWKTADPFKKYRLIQIPIELAPFGTLLYLNTIIVPLRPILDLTAIGIMLLLVTPFLVWIFKGQTTVLRWLRERWIRPIPTRAFVCVVCGHWEICHIGHPKRKCRYCKTRWKDEWADYRLEPLTIDLRLDDLYPGMYR